MKDKAQIVIYWNGKDRKLAKLIKTAIKLGIRHHVVPVK